MPAASLGYDGGKKVPGRKRHIVTDCLGLLLVVAVNAANIGDRDDPVADDHADGSASGTSRRPTLNIPNASRISHRRSANTPASRATSSRSPCTPRPGSP
ncbi:hypothetical protein [Streptomyces melanogenes]|uniref:hypothetical protein n=1 Tax=Streptomyces melanogenes TaxID=67326 RepID=UPI0037A3E433